MTTLSDTYGLAFVKQGLQEGQSVAAPAFAGAMLGAAVGLGGATVLVHSQIRKEMDKHRPTVERVKKLVPRAEAIIGEGEKIVPNVKGLLDWLKKIRETPGLMSKIRRFSR